ncbi:hypothetical protein MD483_11335, partial [Vibrio sp. DBSS07]|nr:hypothetical protein [Vibrio paucivorans]
TLVELRDIAVEAYNKFDTAGFAQLRIYQSGEAYNNKPLDLDIKVEARNCQPFYSAKYQRWTNGFGCYFYVDDKLKSKDQEFNAETLHFDFSQFNEDTVIHYDILAGDDYRTEPLVSKME